MIDIFDNKYIIKTLSQMVVDEVNRIVSSGLVSKNDLSGFLKSSAINNIDYKNQELLVEKLSELYENLHSIKLPGDFTELNKNPLDELIIIVDSPEEIVEDNKESKNEEHEEHEKDEEHEDNSMDASLWAIEILEDIAYKCGSDGKHSAAHLIEKTINSIEHAIDDK